MHHVLLLEMLTWCLVMSCVTKTGVWVVAVSLMFFFSQLMLLYALYSISTGVNYYQPEISFILIDKLTVYVVGRFFCQRCTYICALGF